MMRIAALLLLVLGIASCNRERFVISGTFNNADTLKLYLEEVDIYSINRIDSAIPGNSGNFRFSRKIDMPGFYQLRLSNNQNIVFFPEPGDNIKVTADARNTFPVSVEGSEDTRQIQSLIENLINTKKKLDSLEVAFAASPEEAKEAIAREYDEIMEAHRQFSIAFILTHYNSMASLYALYQQYEPGTYVFSRHTDIQFFKIVSDSLRKYYPDSRHVVALEGFTDNLISKYNASRLLSMAAQNEPGLPGISLPDIGGDTISLESVNARYILVNFWASWSAESVENNRQLIDVYNSFRNRGFEVLAVSLDNSADAWARAIKFDELYWLNVIDEKYPNSQAAVNYNITSLPTTFLIDKEDANIIARNLTPLQLRERLTALLK